MIVRSTNSHQCLRSTTRSRSRSAPSAVQLAAATERVGPPPIRCGPAPAAVSECGHQSRSSLPVRLMNTVSRLGSAIDRSSRSNPPRSAAEHDPRHQPVAALHVQLEPAVHQRGSG